jgi:hypothetical protein
MLGLGEEPISIYLNDHLAGATAGLQLARRVAGRNRASAWGRELEAIAADIESDRTALLHVMDRLAVAQDVVKAALGWGIAQASRLKLTGELLGYTPLSRLEEIEALALGVEGKLALWQALRRALSGDPRLQGVDLDELIARARAQRRLLERLRMQAADDAFVSRSP